METKLISTTGNGAAKDDNSTNNSNTSSSNNVVFMNEHFHNPINSYSDNLSEPTKIMEDNSKEIVSISCGSNVKSNILVENKCLINYNSSSNNNNNNNNNNNITICDGNNKMNSELTDNVVQQHQVDDINQRLCENVKNQIDNLLLDDSINGVSPNPSSPCFSEESFCNQEELDEISKFFEARPVAIEKWLREKASTEVKFRIHTITADHKKSNKNSSRSSVTSELFQQWLCSSPMKVSNIEFKCIFAIILFLIY
jgi:hypothetical protein